VLADNDEIRTCYEKLNEKIANVPRQFIFNVDEVGLSEWSGSKEVRVLVPAECTSPTIPFARGERFKAQICVLLHQPRWYGS
jgi:hypothetical protein